MAKLTYRIGDEVKIIGERCAPARTGVVIGTPHDDNHMYMIQIDHLVDSVKAPRLKGSLELVRKCRACPKYTFENVVILVAKSEDEWLAEYIVDGERDEAKTYFSGGLDQEHKDDAIQTAIDSIQRLKRQRTVAKVEQQLKGETRAVMDKVEMGDGSFVHNVDLLSPDGDAVRFACIDEDHAFKVHDLLTAIVEQCVDVSFQQ